jgi:hypothetical protein
VNYECSSADHYAHQITWSLSLDEFRRSKRRLEHDHRQFMAQRGVVEISTMLTDHDALVDHIMHRYRHWLNTNAGRQNRDWHASVVSTKRRTIGVFFVDQSMAMLFKLTHAGS